MARQKSIRASFLLPMPITSTGAVGSGSDEEAAAAAARRGRRSGRLLRRRKQRHLEEKSRLKRERRGQEEEEWEKMAMDPLVVGMAVAAIERRGRGR